VQQGQQPSDKDAGGSASPLTFTEGVHQHGKKSKDRAARKGRTGRIATSALSNQVWASSSPSSLIPLFTPALPDSVDVVKMVLETCTDRHAPLQHVCSLWSRLSCCRRF